MPDTPQIAAGVREGDVLAGKYRVEKILGVGGMGVVVAAQHVQLDDRVAIKFLLPEALASEEAVARFAREARAAVKIKSEHVARVSDVGTLENGAPYMVMEYLEGSDLSAWLKQRGALPVEQAVEFVLQACEAIAEAHALGIVHRDLKPANLFVLRRPDGALSVKVLDFGISKTTGLGKGSDMTHTSAVMGSPLYMSPEQMHSSKDVDARTDIWAMGVMLYELLTGGSPFMGDSMPELILKIVSAAPPPLRNKRPDAPDGLEAIILKCLDKDRGKRFATVGELAIALLPFAPKRSKLSVERISGVMMAAGLAGSALVLPPSSDEMSRAPEGAGTAGSWGRTTTRRSSGPWVVVGGLGVLAVVGITMTVMRNPGAALDGSPGASPTVLSRVAAANGPSAPVQPTAMKPDVATPLPGASHTPLASPSAPTQGKGQPGKQRGQSKTHREAKAEAAPAASPAAPIITPVAPARAASRATPPAAAPAPHPPKPTDEWGEGRL